MPRSLFVGLLLAAPALAAAATHPASQSSFYQKTTSFVFDDDEVEVSVDQLRDMVIDSRLSAKFPTLIQYRSDFMDAMIKDTEDL
jgi:hypothetical protein